MKKKEPLMIFLNHKIASKASIIFLAILCLFVNRLALAQEADVVKTYQDENGWKLKVNGQDFYVKGVVWGYSPKNENYSYNLWGQEDDFVKKVIDYEFGLMSKAGINTIRSFGTIPPKWVTYVYRKYNIMTAINPLMGRYGATINGVWVPRTNYADPATRKTLKAQVLATVNKYKDVPGVIMFALGNESNYGLSWSSFEIENLPVGEQNQKKAEYLYSLFAETIDAAKAIDKNHLFTIVNGDIQYLDLIVKYGQNWDLLGVNAYRGVNFSELWKDVKAKLGLPVVFFEFGSDAFNARDFAEDQVAQAHYLKSQWLEMYQKSYNQGEEGNSLGGFVFEWRDEWWKYKQTENLDKHDRNASWENGGYKFDHVPGQNNMNEEWWGITRLGDLNADGFYTAEPRMAYHVLSEIWQIDPYASQNNITAFNNINLDTLELRSEIAQLKALNKQSNAFKVSGGSIRVETLFKALSGDVDTDGTDGVDYEQGLIGFVDFEFQPNSKLEGNFSLNFIADNANSDFEFRYGDRIDVDADANSVEMAANANKNTSRFELYDFQASYKAESFDLLGFYHTQRYHWGDEGDFFGLLRETTDIEGQDIWNSKAPYGVEYIGKQSLDGLKVVAGPEVYWGANPKIILKYQFGKNKQYSILHSEDFSRRSGTSGGTAATGRRSNQTTIYGKFNLQANTTLEIGGISGNGNKVGEAYDRLEGDNVVQDKIEFLDTLGIKAKLSLNIQSNIKAYIGANYAGLVADAGENHQKQKGSQIPYSSLGNKKVIEFGADIFNGPYTFSPRFFNRTNLVDANPTIAATTTITVLRPGIATRNSDDDPFAVLGNRDAQSLEFYLTYDNTPETYFYDWDNDFRENAAFAYNVGLTYTEYNKAADSELFFHKESNTNAPFGEGLPAADVWLLKSKMVFNTSSRLKAIINLEAGKQQSSGQVSKNGTVLKPVEYESVEGKFVFKQQDIISGKIVNNGWGPHDFERQFNTTYPRQYEAKYVRLLDKGKTEKNSSKFTIKFLHRTLDENSENEFYQDGLNTDMSEVQAYLEYKF